MAETKMNHLGLATLACLCALDLPAQSEPAPVTPTIRTITAKTRGMRRADGFVTHYWDALDGKLWLEFENLEAEWLYAPSLASGLGSNPVGLDRGKLSREYLVTLQRSGPRLLMVARNTRYRARTDNAAERAAVADSFAPSVLFGFDIAAEEDGRVLVDGTAFLTRDAQGIARQLDASGQGSYRLDASRSAILPERCHAFPDNTEIDVVLTFSTDDPGRLVSATAATGEGFSLRQHHSMVRLPDDGYRPRVHDPRVGMITMSFADYGAPIDAPLKQHWITRHRLEKQDPGAPTSPPVEPIVYHLDPGVPEPVRSALRDGAMWWNDAFTAAGFENAFRVEDLPAGAHPLDIRYNMIHWVHRRTRGWSYGGSVIDPRTGEILKGNVLLGSLRVRQDHLIARGLMSDAGCCGDGAPGAGHLLPTTADPRALELALARLRQLSAHEVGHTLGLTHNFAASTYDDRASVMDYPAPLVDIDDRGELDFSRAYGVGIGTYDTWVIRYAYGQFAPGADEAAELARLVEEGTEHFLYITDRHSRPAGAEHPLGNLWDNGADPVAALDHAMRLRTIGLRDFASAEVDDGEPAARLEERLVPLFLHHRYQLTAAAKSIGGVTFRYAVGTATREVEPVPAAQQRAALTAILECLAPATLTLAEDIRQRIPPHPPGYDDEVFERRTGAVLDPAALAYTAADLVVAELLQRERAARLVAQHARDAKLPGFGEVVTVLVQHTWSSQRPESAVERIALRAAETAVLDRLMSLASDTSASSDVRAIAQAALTELSYFQPAARTDPLEQMHIQAMLRDVKYFLANPGQRTPRGKAPGAPPGAPIGQTDRR